MASQKLLLDLVTCVSIFLWFFFYWSSHPGPYGRCVYDCDNTVVDNQVVAMQFASGRTATLTMVAFTEEICVRKTRLFGSMGEIVCDGDAIVVYDFRTKVRVW